MNIISLIIQEKGLTQFASGMSVSYQAVRKWERHGVPADRVLSLAEFMDWKITPHEIRADLYPHPDDGLPEERRAGGKAA